MAGYDTKANQTQGDWRKSGSIYSVQDVKADKLEGVVRDNEWYTHHVIVKGNRVQIFLNGKLVNDFTEEPGRKAGKDFERQLNEGTIALQGHDPKAVLQYSNVRGGKKRVSVVNTSAGRLGPAGSVGAPWGIPCSTCATSMCTLLAAMGQARVLVTSPTTSSRSGRWVINSCSKGTNIAAVCSA